MSIYLVTLTEPSEGIYERIEKLGLSYQITPTMFLVKPVIGSPATLQEQIGLKPAKGSPCGLIIDVVKGQAVGVMPKAAADWYKEALELDIESRRQPRACRFF